MNVIGTRPDAWWKDRDAAMLRKSPREREEKRDQDQGQRHRRQHDVADEQGNIDGAVRSMHGVVNISVKRVVHDVAD